MLKRTVFGLVLASLETISSFSVAPTKARTVVRSRIPRTALRSTFADFPDEKPDKRGDSTLGRDISSSELREMNEVQRRNTLPDHSHDAKQFLIGEELHELRKQVFKLRRELQLARKLNDDDRIGLLERAILKAQQVDAEFIYKVSLDRLHASQLQGNFREAERYRREAARARSALPQFNLEGLWVGKYNQEDFEMINVTYDGDVLVARKVTDLSKNVPKGEITFQVDLSPGSRNDVLEPIELGSDASKQWGTKFLTRFAGEGQVASRDFAKSKWMDGQLILVNEYFSFAWLPIAHQVFFGRPSPELTLKILRETRSKQYAGDQAREYLTRCWEETEYLKEEMYSLCNDQQDYYNRAGFFE